MNPKVLIGALIGGAIGAVAWAAVAYFLKAEVGYVAIGVGALCGVGAAMMGGSGASSGVTAASIALAAILVGKVGAVYLVLNSLDNPEAVANIAEWNDEDWANAQAEANAFGRISGDRSDWPQYMVTYGYANPPASSVSDEEIAFFEEVHAPVLQGVADRKIGRRGWENYRNQTIADTLAGGASFNSSMDAVVQDLNFFDALFAFLGVAAAWSFGKGKDE